MSPVGVESDLLVVVVMSVVPWLPVELEEDEELELPGVAVEAEDDEDDDDKDDEDDEDVVCWPGILALDVAVAVVVLCSTDEGRPGTRVGPGIS